VLLQGGERDELAHLVELSTRGRTSQCGLRRGRPGE
jgi:hypothetical protein